MGREWLLTCACRLVVCAGAVLCPDPQAESVADLTKRLLRQQGIGSKGGGSKGGGGAPARESGSTPRSARGTAAGGGGPRASATSMTSETSAESGDAHGFGGCA